MSKIYVIILAGGKGTRMEEDTPKQFLILGNKPLILWSTETFSKIDIIDHIIIVSPEEFIPETNALIKKHMPDKILKIISGGATRQKSAYNAVNCHEFHDDDILIFHDAARPFISKDIIIQCINETRIHGAASVYVPATDTIAEIEKGFVKSIPSRKNMYRTQTPQAFLYKIIEDAHEKALLKGINNVTDDVSLVISEGYKIKTVDGDELNIKITRKADFDFALNKFHLDD